MVNESNSVKLCQIIYFTYDGASCYTSSHYIRSLNALYTFKILKILMSVVGILSNHHILALLNGPDTLDLSSAKTDSGHV
jgi:hypothetical protein